MLRQTLICMILVVLAGLCFAQDTNVETDFPYKAQVIGKDVYVRSGSASQYYFTCQLDEPTEVIVVDKRFSWCKIVPPKGSFSWVAKEFIKIDADNPGYGIVTNDNVRVWAGKPDLDPEDSTSPQGKLNINDKVKLLGEESGDYYKIAPPKDAYLWINGDYLKYVGRSDLQIDTKKPVEITPALPAETPAETNEVETPAQTVVVTDTNAPAEKPAEEVVSVITREPEVPTKSQHEIDATKKVYDMIVEIDAERAKPIDQQDYTKFIEALKAVQADEQAGSAQRYAQYQLERIQGYQLASEVDKMITNQDAELTKTLNKIEAKRQKLRSEVKKTDDYLVKGMLKKSLVYDDKMGGQRYLVVDEKGKILCYAIGVGSAASMDMTGYIGQPVGLKGEAVADAATGISLVKFAKIELLEKASK